MSDQYLTLKQAAERLGVHTATLRRWADQGTLKTVRTPGGHRRFSSAEVERIERGEQMSVPDQQAGAEQRREQTLSRTRVRLENHHEEPWVAKMDESSREESRLLGRRLMGLLMQYVAAEDGNGHELLEEACVIGRIYSKSIIMTGISLPQALKATMFFKDHFLESAVILPEQARQNPEANKRVFRRMNEFLNAIQLVVAETFESHETDH